MPSRNINDCVPPLQDLWEKASRLYNELYPSGPSVFLTCTYRTNEEQEALYAKGKTEPGPIVTHIKRNGKHNVYPSKAFDIAFLKSADTCDWTHIHFIRFAEIVQKIAPHVQWGGNWQNFKDMPHFEID